MNDTNDSNSHQDLSDLEESLPPDQKASQDLSSNKKKSKRPWWKRLLIIFSSAILLFIVLVVGAGVILTYYFPSERIKPIAEEEMTRILKIPVSMDSLDLSLLNGLQITRLTLGKENPLFTVKDLTLDYDLTQLLQGRFVINKAVIIDPKFNLLAVDGIWNFQPLLDLAESGAVEEPAPPAKEFEGLPAVPMAVDLMEFGIRNIEINLNQDGHTQGRLQGLSVEARAKLDRNETDLWLQSTFVPPSEGEHNLEFVSSQGKDIDIKTLALMNVEVSTQDLDHVRLTADLGLKKNRVQIGDTLPVPDFSAELDVNASVNNQGVNIPKLTLFLNEENRVNLTGEADQLMSNPRFNIQLNEAALNLEDLIRWAGTLIPPVAAKGKIRVTGLKAKGILPDFQPGNIEISNGKVNIEGFSASHPPLSAALEGVDSEINLVNAKVINGIPESLDAKIQVTMNRGQAENIVVQGLNHNLQIQATGSNLSEVDVDFSTALRSIVADLPDMDPVKTSLDLNGSAKANWQSGDVHSLDVDYAVGSAAKGKVQGQARNFGKTSFEVEKDLDIQFKALRSLVPKNILKTIDGFPSAGDTRVHATVKGQLDENFQPVQALVDTKIDLKGIDTQLKNPPAEAKNISATISFPLDYVPAKGVKISRLDFKSRIGGVKVPDQLELGITEINTQLTMGNFYPLTGETGKVPITNKTSVKIDRVQSLAPEIVLTGLKVDTNLKSDLVGKEAKNVSLDGKVSIRDVEGVQEIKTGAIQTSFAATVNDQSLTKTKASIDVKIDPPAPETLNGKIPIGPITFASRTRQNLKTGNVDIDKVSLIAPSLVNFDLKGKLQKWGKTFDVESKITDTQLAAIWEKVPTAMRTGMEDLKVAGKVHLSVNARGSVPDKIELGKTALPIRAEAGFGLGNASLSWPSKGIAVENMSTTAAVDFKDGTGNLSGNVSLKKVFLKNVLGEDWLNPNFDFKYSLQDFNKFSIDEHRFSIARHGINHSLSGRVDGLKPFLIGKVPTQPQEISRRLNVSLATKNQLDFQKAINEGTKDLLNGIQAKGAMLATVGLKLVPGETVVLDGKVAFDRFNAQIPDVLKVTDLNGKFPFNKTLFLKRVPVETFKDSFLASRKGFFTQLRSFSNNKNNLTLQEVEVAKQKISNIGLDLLFDKNRLMMEKFLFDILDGSVAGNLFVIPTPQGPELSFSTEFAGLNFGALIGRSKKAEESESEIDGNMQLRLNVKQGLDSEPLSIDQIYTRFAITRIGAETLDRFLLFLDPEESKPAIVDTRAKLQLASPHRILVTVENGNLNVEAWLKNKILGDIIKAPELKRVPITSLKQFRDISDQLKSLTGLRDALKYMAARGVKFDENGEIILY